MGRTSLHMATGGKKRRLGVPAIVAGLALGLLVPAAPAAACTRIGGVAVGDCSSTKTKTRKEPSNRTLLLRDLNQDRMRRGLSKLTIDARADEIAREHARRMARRGRVYHNPELKTAAGRRRLGYPTWLGENVGVGPSAESVHEAFMRSRRHRGNILEPAYRAVGLGAYSDGRDLWVVQVFITRGKVAAASRTSSGTVGPTSSDRSTRPSRVAPVARPAARPEGKPVLVGAWPREDEAAKDLSLMASVPSIFGDHEETTIPGIVVLVGLSLPVALLVAGIRRRDART